jgi:hypothetical protein
MCLPSKHDRCHHVYLLCALTPLGILPSFSLFFLTQLPTNVNGTPIHDVIVNHREAMGFLSATFPGAGISAKYTGGLYHVPPSSDFKG